MKIYYAKSGEKKVTNKEHLSKVADLAYKFGQEIDQPDAARLAGQFHDVGKYGDRFQGVLFGIYSGIDHAFSGAALLYCVKGLQQKTNGGTVWGKYEPVIESIQGHHDGLVSMMELASKFNETWKNPQADFCPSNKIPSLRGEIEFNEAIQAFQGDFPDYHFPKLPKRTYKNQIENMLDTRILFSCLVDADYSISASDKDPDYLKKNSGQALNAENALNTLYEYCEQLRLNSKAESGLNQIRNQVFDVCGEAGDRLPGLFTLTAPTGVGKTLAMLHFALRHCKRNNMRRIIVVLPFLTLAEQSEKTYRNIFPEILVDHSQKNLPEEIRELAARWDTPMIITTSVKFFESLFADKPGDCRKLHSIADSVVLFDEAQSLPTELAPATIEAVNTLCRKYHCSMVFSTATQPDFAALPDAEWKPFEIIPDSKVLYERMCRVDVEWRLYADKEKQEAPSLEQIAKEMSAEPSVCAIVNLRCHARKLFEELERYSNRDEEVYLLTTDLCPAHRLAVVEEIKKRLDEQKPCRVVATQCIEAGVDLDFAVMYRALAPLEAIIQAAGRCNRNGRLSGNGRLIVFEPNEEGNMYPGEFYGKAAGVVKKLWNEHKYKLNLNDLETIQKYYAEIFQNETGKASLNKALESKCYHKVAEEYRLITKAGVQIIVPWSGEIKLFHEVQKELWQNGLTAETLRRAAPITVSTFEKEWVEEHAEPLYFQAKRYDTKTESGFYILNTGHEKYYDGKMGLRTESAEPEEYMV